MAPPRPLNRKVPLKELSFFMPPMVPDEMIPAPQKPKKLVNVAIAKTLGFRVTKPRPDFTPDCNSAPEGSVF